MTTAIFNVKQIIWLSSVLFMIGCNEKVVEKRVSIKNLMQLPLDSSGWTDLCVIKTYPAKKTCSPTKEYSNLYVCRQSITDTVYIFEECDEAISDMAFDTTCRYPILIDKKSLRPLKDSVFIFIPEGFELNKNAKFLFAKVSYIVES